MSAQLQVIGAKPSRTSLNLEESLGFNDARKLAAKVVRMGESANWWIGEILLHLDRFRRDYPEALAEIDRTYSSQKVLKWVASRVDPVTRVTELSWSHHRAVAALEPEQQRYWLDEAQRHGWSKAELEQAIAEAHGGRKPAPALMVRAVGDLYAICVRAAAHAGVEPAAWAHAALERAARDELEAAA